MQITYKEITVREIYEGYVNNADEGVRGYGGLLDIRPPYQREFVYKDKQRDAVINSVRNGFPLNVMYWCKTKIEPVVDVDDDDEEAAEADETDEHMQEATDIADEENDAAEATTDLVDDDTDEEAEYHYEVLDGQQRTISLCEYIAGKFSINYQFFHNLTEDQQEQILDYKLMIYICDGTDSEKLEWFKTINIAGEKLTDQELRNAIYTGPWLADAKKRFSKPQCVAYKIASDYVSGSPIRQEFLQTAISWINDGDIEGYMAAHQHDANANKLWLHFKKVIDWVEATFPVKHKEKSIMKKVNWGKLYKKHKDDELNSEELEKQIKKLLIDDDVTSKPGVYPYVLGEGEKWLSIRAFTDKQKIEAFERQNGHCYAKDCPEPDKKFDITEMHADHIVPWSKGGRTTSENCRMLCSACNLKKSDK